MHRNLFAKTLPYFFLFIISLLYPSAGIGQKYNNDDELHLLLKTLQEKHVQPRLLNQSFLSETYARFPEVIDPNHLFLLEKEITEAQATPGTSPAEIETQLSSFLKIINPVLKTALQRSRQLLAIKTDAINWAAQEEFIPTPKGWCKTENELKERWRLWIKYNVLLNLQSRTFYDSTAASTLAYVQQHEKEETNRILSRQATQIQRMIEPPEGFDKHMALLYLKLIASQFDPHSVYFSPDEMENFIGSVSDQKFSFGLQLSEHENGDVFIQYLIPGGPAWKSGELHQNDILVKMQRAGQPSVNLEGIGLYELGELIDDDNHSVIDFTVRKGSGELTTVSLQKEKIYAEENIVKGYLLKNKNNIGYISLPGFYSNWGTDGGASCANDVAKEIVKMKKENIQGLILDLRSNGGGSLQEAISMAGIFIDEGPLLLMKDKTGKVTTLKDMNRGTVYDGPLIVLVNAQSASASEMFAGTLQDYERALIVGGRTYGKSTGQRMHSLHPSTTPQQQTIVLGQSFATITDIIVYRVTTQSAQARGVIPDIKLPDLYDIPAIHEEGMADVLKTDSITKNVLYQKLPAIPKAELQVKSLQRTKDDTYFQQVTTLNKQLAIAFDKQKSAHLLKWSDFITKPSVPYNAGETNALYKAIPLNHDSSVIADSSENNNNKLIIHELEQDHYLAEAYKIINDYISIKK